MPITTRTLPASAYAVLLTLGLIAAPATGQAPAGDVRRVEGKAAVARTAALQPAPLKARDNLFLRDLVTTGEQSKAQLLLLGKAVVTMREQSALRITEVPGVATVEMTDGRLKLALLKDRVKPGERVDVKTPNAITAVRGTVVVVEVLPGATSRFTVLSGFVDVWGLDPTTGRPTGNPVRLNALQQATVTALNPPSAPQTISRSEGQLIDATYTFALKPAAPDADVLKRQTEQAARDAASVQGPGGSLVQPGGQGGPPDVSGDAIRARSVPTPPPSGRSPRGN